MGQTKATLSLDYPNLLRQQIPGFLSQTGAYPRHLVTQSDLLIAARLVEEEGDWEPLTQYANDPVKFARQVLGIRLWSKQRQILQALTTDPRVTVAACYGSGKTYLAAVAVVWFMTTRRPCLVVTTAPTQRQVRDLLWRELATLHKNALIRLPGQVRCDRWIISHDRMAKGYTGKGENNVAGLHSPANVFFIEDEAAGIEKKTEEGFSGITIGPGNRRLKIGNPICEAGPFFDSHMHPKLREQWTRFTIDALETPNVRGVFRPKPGGKDGETELVIRETRHLIPGLVDRAWVEQAKIRWLDQGIKSHWESRCRGKFFITSAEKVVPVEWALAAQGRWEWTPSVGLRVLGCDIAGGGQDSTKICLLEGRRARILDAWQIEDHDEQARRIAIHAKEQSAEVIVCDATGIGNAVYLALKHLQDSGFLPSNIQIIGVRLGTRAEDFETYNVRSDEVQFDMRWALNPANPEAIAIDPGDSQLREEVCLRSWWKNDRHRVQTDGKSQLKAKGFQNSPDGADALSMCCIKLPQRMALL